MYWDWSHIKIFFFQKEVVFTIEKNGCIRGPAQFKPVLLKDVCVYIHTETDILSYFKTMLKIVPFLPYFKHFLKHNHELCMREFTGEKCASFFKSRIEDSKRVF